MAGQDAELGKLASTTSLGNFYRGQKKDFLALMQSYRRHSSTAWSVIYC